MSFRNKTVIQEVAKPVAGTWQLLCHLGSGKIALIIPGPNIEELEFLSYRGVGPAQFLGDVLLLHPAGVV